MQKDLLIQKYKDFILEDKDKFKNELEFIYNKIQFKNLNNSPLLIYSQNKRNALYYILSMHYALKKDRLLNYAVVTGQTLNNQHFATAQTKDAELHERVYYSDITFVSLSQYDYTNEYLESQIIDLIEFRKANGKMTIISYDVMTSTQNYITLTKKLHAYFLNNEFQIVDITSNRPGAVFDKQSGQPKKKRIL
jgi:hypothetical protein